MQVRELCICDVAAARPDMTLDRAGALMHKYDIGCLPVVDEGERVVGMITDRDMMMELARRDRRPSQVLVEDVMSEDPATLTGDEDVLDALELMKRNRVRRVPVVDDEGLLEGILSIDDIIVHASEDGGRWIPAEEVVDTLAEIIDEYSAETGRRGSHHGTGGSGAYRQELEYGRPTRLRPPRRAV